MSPVRAYVVVTGRTTYCGCGSTCWSCWRHDASDSKCRSTYRRSSRRCSTSSTGWMRSR